MPNAEYCERRCTREWCDLCEFQAPEPEPDDDTPDEWDAHDEAAHRADLAYHDANC